MPATSRAPPRLPTSSASRSTSSTPPAAPTRPTPPSRISRSSAPTPSSTWCFRGRRSAPALPLPAAPTSRSSPGAAGSAARVAATNGSGGPMVVPVNDLMIKTMGGKGSLLELTYHTGEVCRNREVELDKALASLSRHQGDQERSAHPRLFRGRRAIRQCVARQPSGRQREPGDLGLLGRSGHRRHRRAARARAATTSRSTASTATPRRSRTSRTAS